MSDTPRTDAVLPYGAGANPEVQHVALQLAGLARTLERELADATMRLSEASRWIPVTERLPGDDADVLVNVYDSRWKDSSIYTAEYSPISGWECPGGKVEKFHYRVTHWMPLPAAPEVTK